MFATYYKIDLTSYDSDEDENAYQPPDEDDEPDTLNEQVPSECLFTKYHHNPKFDLYDTLTPKQLCEEYYSVRMALSELSKDVTPTKINISKEYQRLKLYLEKKGVNHNSWTGQIEFKSPITVDKITTKKQSKNGLFNICGRYGKDPKNCSCFYCTGYIKDIRFEDGWHATKLNVQFNDKDYVKSKGALWSTREKCWYTRASSPHYNDLVHKF